MMFVAVQFHCAARTRVIQIDVVELEQVIHVKLTNSGHGGW
jgi:hypothetical protein